MEVIMEELYEEDDELENKIKNYDTSKIVLNYGYKFTVLCRTCDIIPKEGKGKIYQLRDLETVMRIEIIKEENKKLYYVREIYNVALKKRDDRESEYNVFIEDILVEYLSKKDGQHAILSIGL